MAIKDKVEFMSTKEFRKLPDAVRFSVEREVRSHYFDMVCPTGDWKEPFYCDHDEKDTEQIDLACKFFTGNGISEVGHRPNGNVVSYCKGYYLMGT